MQTILLAHAHRYPHWTLHDLYKLIHQAAMGSEHAIRDQASVHRWLIREIAEMGDGPDDPLLDLLSPDGQIVRIHLRPYVRRSLDPEILHRAFILTGKEFSQSPANVLTYADIALHLTQTGQLPFQPPALQALIAEMQAAGFPAVHHSPAYETAYRPAYRVIARTLLPPEFLLHVK
ncbi:MAG: hypothetical protein H6636_01510 [Anaerolineales bacterium]|nr:hypothetical protein [Anaerolineales bacterium]